MTLYQICSYLKEIALSSPYIRSAYEGSVYQCMNGNPHSKYGVFVVSQTLHRQDEIFDYYGLNLFVIDRLVDDLESNRLQIQSLAKEVLANTILTFVTKFYGITHNELQFHPFTEKFVDLTAGQYVQVTFQVPKNLICPDDYGIEFWNEYKLLPLNVEIYDNGIFEYEPTSDYIGYDSVKVTVNVPTVVSGYTEEDLENAYESGVTSGITYQKSLIIPLTVDENGVYEREDGYNPVTVNIDTDAYYNSGYTSGMTDGVESGITYQKSLLQDITITHNGEYTNENGYSAITVNVPQTGESINNQTKSVEYSGNGSYSVSYDEGFTGLEAVNITVNVPQSAYTSGYTQEDLDEAYLSGETHQKSLLSAITITNNGTYVRDNGYSAITVNINTNAWYQSGKTDQKSLLSAITITQNGTYTRANGYSAITVNVDTTSCYEEGYEDGVQDTIDRFTYLTIVPRESGTIRWYATGCEDGPCSATPKTIYYQINDNGIWRPLTSSLNGVSISVQAGQVIRFKGDNNSLGRSYNSATTGFMILRSSFDIDNLSCYVYGNPYSLLDSSNFGNMTTLKEECSLPYLFIGAEKMNIPSNHKLILQATGLTNYCYTYMFWGCSSLTKAPELPATILKPACYEYMFAGCSKLTSAPVLPAPILVEHCYYYMFINCVKLKYIKALFTYIPTSLNSTYHWVEEVASSGTFVKATNATWTTTGVNGVPIGWTIERE